MEIYKSKGKLLYQGNFARLKRIRTSLQADTLHTNTDHQFFTTGKIAGKSNYLKAINIQNQKLREISWIHSHLVRGPLARILGLVQIIENLKDAGEMRTTLEYLSISANELDSAIRQISDQSLPVSV